MDRKFGYPIFIGLVFGAILGLFFGQSTGNTFLGVGTGALMGVFIGWFAAAAIQQSRKEKR